jgi:hypothetical protein
MQTIYCFNTRIAGVDLRARRTAFNACEINFNLVASGFSEEQQRGLIEFADLAEFEFGTRVTSEFGTSISFRDFPDCITEVGLENFFEFVCELFCDRAESIDSDVIGGVFDFAAGVQANEALEFTFDLSVLSDLSDSEFESLFFYSYPNEQYTYIAPIEVIGGLSDRSRVTVRYDNEDGPYARDYMQAMLLSCIFSHVADVYKIREQTLISSGLHRA